MSARKLRRRAGASAALITATVAVAACGSSGATDGSSAASAGTSGGSSSAMSVSFGQPLLTLDPINVDQNQVQMVDNLLYDTLVSYNSKDQLVDELATGATYEDGARKVAITIHSGATFHNGDPLTAKDVVFTLERDLKVGTGIASELSDLKSATATSATGLTLTLKQADALFVPHLSRIDILDEAALTPHLGSNEGQTYLATHDVGSGPYELVKSGTPTTLKRFSGYWNYNAALPASYSFSSEEDSATAIEQVKSGQVDLATDVEDPQATAAAGGDIAVKWLADDNTSYIFMNTSAGPTANLAVRQAVQLAYDYAGGLKEFFDGEGTVQNGPMPAGLPCTLPGAAYSQNLTKAKQILAAAGISHLTLTLRDQPSLPDMVQEATLLQSSLAKIGITLKLDPITFPNYLASLENPKTIPEMALIQDTPAEPDSGLYMTAAYDSANIGSTNRAGYSNPTVNHLLSEIQTDTNESTSCELEQKAESIVNRDAAAVDMYTLKAPVVYRSGITGIAPSPIAYPLNLRTVEFSAGN